MVTALVVSSFCLFWVSTHDPVLMMRGHCYKMSFSNVVRFNKYTDSPWKLCHGLIHLNGELTGHAWIERADLVINDDQKAYPKTTFYDNAGVAQVECFSLSEATENLRASEHFGPWTRHNGNLSDAVDWVNK